MDWSKLMEKTVYGVMFLMSTLFLYVIFGPDIPIIVLLTMIYLKIGDDNEQ